jgi:hypothetical protein
LARNAANRYASAPQQHAARNLSESTAGLRTSLRACCSLVTTALLLTLLSESVVFFPLGARSREPQAGCTVLYPAEPTGRTAMTKIVMTVFVMMSVGSLVACSSSASLVRKDTVCGRVQLAGAYMPAMADARMLMVEHCNGRFEHVELGRAVEFHCT